jgi:hypothetical protein
MAVPTVELRCHDDEDCSANAEDLNSVRIATWSAIPRMVSLTYHCQQHQVIIVPGLLEPSNTNPHAQKNHNHSNGKQYQFHDHQS